MLDWLKHRLAPILKTTLAGWQRDEGFLMSAAMAYQAAFSLFPLCLVLMAVLGLLARFSPEARDTQRDLLAAVAQSAGPGLAHQLRSILTGVKTQAGVGGPVGLATSILAAIAIFAQFEALFDRIWGIRDAQPKGWLAALRSALVERLTAFLMFMGLGLLVIALCVSNVVLSGVRERVVEWSAGRYAWQSMQTCITIIVNAMVFTLIYRIFPKARIRWREALGGGLLVAVAWEVGQRVFEQFLIADKYSAYGVVGSFIAVMLWIYYASAMVFLGAEFVRAICLNCEPPKELRPGPGSAGSSPSQAGHPG